jgi:hypothetical protein
MTRRPVPFRETPEAAALNQSGDADGRAAAALDISARLDCHGIIGREPCRAGANRDCRPRALCCRATFADKGVVRGDRVHRMRPDQQRVRRVGRALVAVAAAFDDKPQIVLAGEIDSRRHVARVMRGDRIDAACCGPSVDPSGALRRARMVLNEIGVAQVFDGCLTGGGSRIARATGKRRLDLDEAPAEALLEPVPLGSIGPFRVLRPHPMRRPGGRARRRLQDGRERQRSGHRQ